MSDNILEFPIRSDIGINEENCGVALFKYLKKHGNNICQIDAITNEQQTFNELLKKSIAAAQNLELKNLKNDDVIVLCAGNSLDTSVAFLACIYLGIKLCPIDPSVSDEDCLHYLSLSKPKIVFCELECADMMRNTLNKIGLDSEIVVFGEKSGYSSWKDYLKPTGREEEFKPKKVDKDGICLINCSSGTTGKPKAAIVTHRGLLSKFKNPEVADISKTVMFYVTSFGWLSGSCMFMTSVFYGNIQVLARKPHGDLILQVIDKYKINFVFLSLSYVYNLINNPNFEKYDLSSLKYVTMGGTVFNEPLYKRLKEKLPKTCLIGNGYGITEICGLVTSFNLPEDVPYFFSKPLSVGRGFPGSIIKVVDIESRKPLGPNARGEICVKTDIFKGYYNDPEATATAIDSDGFFMTGDIGYYDEDRFFYVVDRLKDLFKYQVWLINPSELEAVLLTHPDVSEAAVIGIPHEQDYERPMGIVVLKQGATVTENDILQFYNDKVSDRKKLRAGLKIMDCLPFTVASGKLKRKYLREQILLEMAQDKSQQNH